MINAQGARRTPRDDSRSLNSHSNSSRAKRGTPNNHPQIRLKIPICKGNPDVVKRAAKLQAIPSRRSAFERFKEDDRNIEKAREPQLKLHDEIIRNRDNPITLRRNTDTEYTSRYNQVPKFGQVSENFDPQVAMINAKNQTRLNEFR